MFRKYSFIILLSMLASCASIQTQGTMQIDSIIDSQILDSPEVITQPEKIIIKSALVEAKSEIITETKVAAAEKAKADQNAKLAGQAKVFWGILIIGVIGLIVVGVTKIKKWL